MPVIVEYLSDERIAIVKIEGMVSSEELDSVIMNEVIVFIQEQTPHTVNVIFDVREYQSDFKQFIEYLSRASQRRSNNAIPANLIQHFVGSNTWVNNFRTWLKKNFNEQMNAFTTVELALEYIRNQN